MFFAPLPHAGLSDVAAYCLNINRRVGAFLTQQHRFIKNEVMCGNYGEEKQKNQPSLTLISSGPIELDHPSTGSKVLYVTSTL